MCTPDARFIYKCLVSEAGIDKFERHKKSIVAPTFRKIVPNIAKVWHSSYCAYANWSLLKSLIHDVWFRIYFLKQKVIANELFFVLSAIDGVARVIYQ